MSCTAKYDQVRDAVYVRADNATSLFMPTLEDFDAIRLHIPTISHTGGRLSDAYAQEGFVYIIPPVQYTSCIKNIYQMIEFDPTKRIYVDRKVGNWIYDEACKCLSASTIEGRIDIGDGFIVPSPAEQTKISNLVFSSGRSFYNAVKESCPDIVPPVQSLSCIEGLLRTNWTYYDIYRACRAEYVAAQAMLPATTPSTSPVSPGGSPAPEEKSKKTLLYISGAILIFIFLTTQS